MSILRRQLRAGALATLSIQAVVLMLGFASVCRAARHTHGAGAASDCTMHHQPPATAEPSSGQHHHGETNNDSAAGVPSLQCGCSDSAALFTGETGVIIGGSSIRRPATKSDAVTVPTASVFNLGFSPLSPPPRASIA